MLCLRVLLLGATLFLATGYQGVVAGDKAGAKSPDQAAKQFIEALKSTDRKAYDAVVQPSEIAGSMFEFAVAGERFKRKVLKAHGEVGWNNFQDSEGATIKLAYQDLQLDQLKFDVKDELAIGKLPKESDGLHLLRKDGQWYIDLEATLKGQDKNGSLTADSLAKAFTSMSKTIAKYEEKLGEGISIDQLDKEMGAEFLAALVDAGAQPSISVQVK